MTTSTIIILVLIGIGFIAVTISLIWTKLIRPSQFCYTSTSYMVKTELKRIFKDLKKNQKIKEGYIDATFNLDSMKFGNIPYLLKGNKIFLITNPIYWNIKKVTINNNTICCLDNKDKRFTLPLEIDAFLIFEKKFAKFFLLKQEIKIIIPCLNKKFNETEINGIHFIKTTNLKNFILSIECNEDEKDNLNEKFNEIKSRVILQKPKRGFFKPRTVSIL